MPPLPVSISSFSEFAVEYPAYRSIGIANNPGSGNWPSANLAMYIPVHIPFTFPVARCFWGNGSVGGANVDFGIYSVDGTRLASIGTTAQSGTSTAQYATISYVMAPGTYYFGFSCSGTTNTVYLQTSMTAVGGRVLGMLQEASAVPLPATMTGVTFAQTVYPICGVTRLSS